jgi:hypothetical protein
MRPAPEAMVRLGILVEFQTRRLLIVAVEALGLSVLVDREAVLLSHVDNICSAFQVFNIAYKIIFLALRCCVWVTSFCSV